MIWPAVTNIFPAFTDTFEGLLPFMYLDVRGLVTTGRGDLIDPFPAALSLPWLQKSSSQPATAVDIQREWDYVKSRQDLKLMGGGVFRPLTGLFLPQRSIDAMLHIRVGEIDTFLIRRFDGWSSLPADAQLATLSLSWACGPMFQFPKFESAIKDRDFLTASLEVKMNETANPGLIKRNIANHMLLVAAAETQSTNRDPAVIYGWRAL